MAAPAKGFKARIVKLEAALERAEATYKSGQTISAKPMTELVGTTWPSLRDWCDEFPKLEKSGSVIRGGNGVEWAFHPIRAIKILLDEFRKKAGYESALVKSTLPTLQTDRPFHEIKQSLEVLRMLRIEEVERKALSSNEDHAAIWDEAIDLVMRTITSCSTQIDPQGQLSAHARSLYDDWARSTLLELHERLGLIGARFNANSRTGRTSH